MSSNKNHELKPRDLANVPRSANCETRPSLCRIRSPTTQDAWAAHACPEVCKEAEARAPSVTARLPCTRGGGWIRQGGPAISLALKYVNMSRDTFGPGRLRRLSCHLHRLPRAVNTLTYLMGVEGGRGAANVIPPRERGRVVAHSVLVVKVMVARTPVERQEGEGCLQNDQFDGPKNLRIGCSEIQCACALSCARV